MKRIPAAASSGTWSAVEFGKITVGGDLDRRAQQNRRRLQHTVYCVPKVFESVTATEFPGDWVGRTLLGNTLLARSTSQDCPEARRMVHDLPARLNVGGYLGEVLNPRALNEQQLGSHGWLIRGLCEYYAWTREPIAGDLLNDILRNLVPPMKGVWESYPLTGDARQPASGGTIGSAQRRAGRWVLSTDIGNLFILLDGLTQAWQIDRDAEVKAVIDEGIDRFLRMDLLAVQAQTHATLTSLRALLRMYGQTGESRLLQAAEERYALYSRFAMTENYANYNWFGRPDTWTEPCAIIDSFLVATQLWQFTGQAQYLEEAHLIWFNGVGHGQRSTGGFGTDSCAGFNTPFLKMSMYEAFFCCTMRGGESHSYAIQSSYHTRPGELAVTFYNDSKADLNLGTGQVVLQQLTRYPYDGAVHLKVISSTVHTPITVRLFVPSWMTQPRLRLNGRPLPGATERGFFVARFKPLPQDHLVLNCKLQSWVRSTRNPHSLPGYHALHAGPLMLGCNGDREISLPSAADVQGTGVVLARINDVNDMPLPKHDPLDVLVEPKRLSEVNDWMVPEKDSCRRQILFR